MQAEHPKASGDCVHLPLFAHKVKQARDVVMTPGLPYSYPHMTGESYRVTAWPRKRQIVWSARLPLSIWDLLSDFFPVVSLSIAFLSLTRCQLGGSSGKRPCLAGTAGKVRFGDSVPTCSDRGPNEWRARGLYKKYKQRTRLAASSHWSSLV